MSQSFSDFLDRPNHALLTDLNEAQAEAVSLEDQHHALIIAGAGSGKTKVLSHRTAWLSTQLKHSTASLMCVTFTNKAAGEMRHRIGGLIQSNIGHMWLGTFHSLSHRFLRQHAAECGLDEQFQIIDTDDQVRLCRQIVRELNYDDKHYTPKQAAQFISAHKDKGMRSGAVSRDNEWVSVMAEVFARYDEICARDSLVDFAELLLRTVEVWRDNAKLLTIYQQRFAHLLIDEFQDTNSTQYAWVQMLAGTSACVFAVGDDDQSIYGWRGAKVENILNFERDFQATHPVKTIRLEQNYRSTGNILNAANAVIANNPERLGKQLWTSADDGAPIGIYRAINGLDEADFVVDTIEEILEEGHSSNYIAILYRSNAQSRVFEDLLLRNHVPYQIYGGLRFFERAEIKDVLAYARIAHNPNDNTAFLRIINLPPRGIGAKAIETLTQRARETNVSLWEAAHGISAPTSKVGLFLAMINEWRPLSSSLKLGEFFEHLIQNSGLLAHYAKEGSERLQTKKENLDELVVAASGYEEEGLSQFLTDTTLDAGERSAQDAEEKVQLMTLHSAKGLEFPWVFMVGVEDGLLPSARSINEEKKLAEERRLAYVGITRAKHKLYISFADSRQLYGHQFVSHPPSRFLRDLPEASLDLIGFDA